MNQDAVTNDPKSKTRPPGFGLGIALAAGFFVLFMMIGLGGLVGGALAGGLGMGIGMVIGKLTSAQPGGSE